MKVATIIIVIIGVLAAAGMGIFWVTDYNSAKETLASSDTLTQELVKASGLDLAQYESRRNSGYGLIIGGVLSLVSLIFISKLKKISAVIILLSAIVPAIILPSSLIVSFILIIGGILAFFVKPKVVAA
ncbi:MAG: hypothetical protein ACYDG2_18310 [Ruminiclostridium sp.]